MRGPDAGYVPALTGLRGIAAWWVVLYHFSDPLTGIAPVWFYGFVKQGYLAVDLFFVLSGYVIYLTSAKGLQSVTWPSVARFWINRLIRIYPLHLVVMLLYLLNPLALWLFSETGVGVGRYDWGYFFASLLLVQNWGFFDDLQWNIPAWSISTEFAAYLIAPVFFGLFLVRAKVNRPMLLMGLLAGAAGVALLFFAEGKKSVGDAIPSLGVARCVLEFWMGLCLGAYCGQSGRASAAGHWARSCAIALLLILFVALVMSGAPNFWYVPAIFAALIFLLVQGDVVFSRLLSVSWVHNLGVVSYSTYLAHYFVKDWVKFLSDSVGVYQLLVYLLACAAASVVLYRWVEEPARRKLRQRLLGVAA